MRIIIAMSIVVWVVNKILVQSDDGLLLFFCTIVIVLDYSVVVRLVVVDCCWEVVLTIKEVLN